MIRRDPVYKDTPKSRTLGQHYTKSHIQHYLCCNQKGYFSQPIHDLIGRGKHISERINRQMSHVAANTEHMNIILD
jgi:hypothetical protein